MFFIAFSALPYVLLAAQLIVAERVESHEDKVRESERERATEGWRERDRRRETERRRKKLREIKNESKGC